MTRGGGSWRRSRGFRCNVARATSPWVSVLRDVGPYPAQGNSERSDLFFKSVRRGVACAIALFRLRRKSLGTAIHGLVARATAGGEGGRGGQESFPKGHTRKRLFQQKGPATILRRRKTAINGFGRTLLGVDRPRLGIQAWRQDVSARQGCRTGGRGRDGSRREWRGGLRSRGGRR